MIEHPVPQNITQYEFHLIGNMTIKQFLMLLAGVILGFLVYSTNLPGIIMWPIVFVIVVTAIAMAFVPYEERTLDEWMVNFVRAIYRPTKYYWRRLARTPDYFVYTTHQTAAQMAPQLDRTPMRRKQVSAFLSSINGPQEAPIAQDPLDLFDSSTDSLSQLFDSVPAAANVMPGTAGTTPSKPKLQVRARPLGVTGSKVFEQSASATPASTKPSTPVMLPTPAPTPGGILTMETEHDDQSAATSAPSQPTGNAQVQELSQAPISITPSAPVEEAPAAITPLPTDEAGTQSEHYLTAETAADQPQIPTGPATVPVVFNRELPFPSLPDQPNLLLGMVHAGTAIVPSAIVEILDASGTTMRAMKTNTLGQFYISTPLKTGIYTIETEAAGKQFPVYALEVNDTVLDPIDIQAIS